MHKYGKIRVSTDDGNTDIWEAQKGQCDDYALGDGVFLIKEGGALAGVYSMAHVVSIKIEGGDGGDV